MAWFRGGSGAKVALWVAGLLLASAQNARALPSFARQTGQQCAACHNGFPELTPYGRQFRLNGYTFSTSDAPIIPLAGMLADSFTNTQKAVDIPALPGASRNDNLQTEVVLLFLAGKITDHIGIYAAAGYVPIIHTSGLGHTDVRYANTATLFGKETTYGLSVNNCPGQIDPWNSAQNYNNYPYETSPFQPTPVASTAIQGRYDQQVVGGAAYVSWNQLLYASAGVYQGLSASTLNSLGINTRGTSLIAAPAPYWRLAAEPAWGHNTLEFGTFGMDLPVNPLRISTSGTDRTVDVGVDSEYQYLADRNSFSVIGSYIYEDSSLDASRALGLASNSRETLHSLNLKGTYAYDQTYFANWGPFWTAGSRDQALYGRGGSANGSPNTAGWIGELDYYPFNRGGPSFWHALGLKFGLQYTNYSRFNGAATNYDGLGRSASANNTLLLYSWLAF